MFALSPAPAAVDGFCPQCEQTVTDLQERDILQGVAYCPKCVFQLVLVPKVDPR